MAETLIVVEVDELDIDIWFAFADFARTEPMAAVPINAPSVKSDFFDMLPSSLVKKEEIFFFIFGNFDLSGIVILINLF
ncbi:MAG: hypothetical protein KKF44_09750 [Nanoarchaeota archaeon]|nr:hypothetical protein [Nanoarchaeota archaeon]